MQQALFVNFENPFPADSGGRIRTARLLAFLERHYAVDLLTTARPDNPALADARRRYRMTEVAPGPSPYRAAFRSLYRPRNCGVVSHADLGLLPALHRLCAARSYELVFLGSTMLGHLLPALRRLLPRARVVTVSHNFETTLAEQVARAQTHPLRRAFFARNVRLTRRDERRLCAATDLLLATSEDEAARFAALAPGVAGRLAVLPNFLADSDYAPHRRPPPPGPAVIFPGDFGYHPNAEAAAHFHAAIWPRVRAAVPGATWTVAGRDPPPAVAALAAADPSVTITGWVADMRARIADHRVVVVPLLQGAGTRLKILEAWALGRPVVSTAVGCDGLACRDGRDLLVADDPAAFAEAVARLLRDDALAARLAAGGRRTFLARYEAAAVEGALWTRLRAAFGAGGDAALAVA